MGLENQSLEQHIRNRLARTKLFILLTMLVFCGVSGSAYLLTAHRSACDLVLLRAESITAPLAREIVLGDRSLSEGMFAEFKAVVRDLLHSENISLTVVPPARRTNIVAAQLTPSSCKIGFLGAQLSVPIYFGTTRVGNIQGNVSVFSWSFAALLIMALVFVVFVFINRLVQGLSSDLRNNVVLPIVRLTKEEDVSFERQVPSEVLEIQANIHNLRQSLEESTRIKYDLEKTRGIADMARQIAHDIRSPLTALSVGMEILDLDKVPEKRDC